MARTRREFNLASRASWRGFVEFYSSDNLTFAASIAYYARCPRGQYRFAARGG